MASAARAKENRPSCFEWGAGEGPGNEDCPEWESISTELQDITLELRNQQASGLDEIREVLEVMALEEEPESDETSSDDRTDVNNFSARKRVFYLQDKLAKKASKDPQRTKEQTDDKNQKVKVGLLNVRSLNNKTDRICALITERELDIFLLTETWLKSDNADELLRKACPPNFHSYHQNRPERQGGGVANLFSEEFQHSLIGRCAEETFEGLAVHLQHTGWNQPVLCINVYHSPPKNLKKFVEFYNAFVRFFNNVSQGYKCILMTGDFNLHFEKTNRLNNAIFNIFLKRYGLKQHVMEPTHRAGHTLDLVLTRNVEFSDGSIKDDEISDHFTAYFSARPKVYSEGRALMRIARSLQRYLKRLE